MFLFIGEELGKSSACFLRTFFQVVLPIPEMRSRGFSLGGKAAKPLPTPPPTHPLAASAETTPPKLAIYPGEPLSAFLFLTQSELAISIDRSSTWSFPLHSLFLTYDFPDTATLGSVQEAQEWRCVLTGSHLRSTLCALEKIQAAHTQRILRGLAPEPRNSLPITLDMLLPPDSPAPAVLDKLCFEQSCVLQARQVESGRAWLVELDLGAKLDGKTTFHSALLATNHHLAFVSPPPAPLSYPKMPALRLNLPLDKLIKFTMDDSGGLTLGTRQARATIRSEHVQEIFNFVRPLWKGERPAPLLHSNSFHNWKVASDDSAAAKASSFSSMVRNSGSSTPPISHKFSTKEIRFNKKTVMVNPTENFLITEQERVLEAAQQPIWDELRVSPESAVIRTPNPDIRTVRVLPVGAVFDGVPLNLRPLVWELLSGASNRSVAEEQYFELLEYYAGEVCPSQTAIEKDLNRSMPGHPIYSTPEGIEKLRRVLTAYAWRNPGIGYCQSMNIVAAYLLLLYSESRAFWMLTVIAEELLPGYWTPLMSGALAAQRVVNELVAERLPRLAAHLVENNVDAGLVAFQWFLQLFIGKLPQVCLFSFLDHFFLEGQRALFRWALAILEVLEGRLLAEEEDVQRILVGVLSLELMPLLKVLTNTQFEVDAMLRRAEAAVHVQLCAAVPPPADTDFQPINRADSDGRASSPLSPTTADGRRTPDETRSRRGSFFASLFGKKQQ